MSQTELTGNRPAGTSVRRHTLHVHVDDLRRLKRATAEEAGRAYFVLGPKSPRGAAIIVVAAVLPLVAMRVDRLRRVMPVLGSGQRSASPPSR
ncbi:hypothetical protein ACIQMJ_19335 [Actinosynnema sp. NPDC091369]